MECEFCGKEISEFEIIDCLEIECPDLVEAFLEDYKKVKVFKKFLDTHTWYYATDYEEQDAYVVKLYENEYIKKHIGKCQKSDKDLIKEIVDFEYFKLGFYSYEDRKEYSYGGETLPKITK